MRDRLFVRLTLPAGQRRLADRCGKRGAAWRGWPAVSSSDTRERLLAAGVELLYEAGVVSGVGHVKLAAVAARAGYTAGAVYRCWPSQQDFHRDLARAAILREERASIADIVSDIRRLVDAGAPLLEVLRIAAHGNVYRTPERTDFFVALALRASALSNPDLVDASIERVGEGLAAHRELFSALAELYHRRMRPPKERRQLNQAIFERIEIKDDGEVLHEFAQPFGLLLGEQMQQAAPEATRPGQV